MLYLLRGCSLITYTVSGKRGLSFVLHLPPGHKALGINAKKCTFRNDSGTCPGSNLFDSMLQPEMDLHMKDFSGTFNLPAYLLISAKL